jgi:hypothetical protein
MNMSPATPAATTGRIGKVERGVKRPGLQPEAGVERF